MVQTTSFWIHAPLLEKLWERNGLWRKKSRLEG